MKEIEKLFGIVRLIGKAVTTNQSTADFMSDIKVSGLTDNNETLGFLKSFMEEKKHDFFSDFIKFKLNNGANYSELQRSSKIYDAIHGFTTKFIAGLSELAQAHYARDAKLKQNLESINNQDYLESVEKLSTFAHNLINDLYERSGNKQLDDQTLDKLSEFKKKITDSLTKEPATLVYSYIKDHVFKLTNQLNTVNDLNAKFSNSAYNSSDELIEKLVDFGTLYSQETSQFLSAEQNIIYNIINTILYSTNVLFTSVQENLSSEQFIAKLISASLLVKDSSSFEADKAEYLEQFELCKSQNLSFKQIFENQVALTKNSLKTMDFATIEMLYNSAVAKNVEILKEVLESFEPKKDLLFSAEQELTQKLQNPNTDESLSYCQYFYTTLLTEPQNPIGICNDLVKEKNGMIFLQIKSPYNVLIDNNQILLKQNLIEQDTLTKLDQNLIEVLKSHDGSDTELLDKTVQTYADLLKHLYLYSQTNENLMTKALRESYESCDSTQQRIENLNQLDTPEHWYSQSCYQCDIDKLHQPPEYNCNPDWL